MTATASVTLDLTFDRQTRPVTFTAYLPGEQPAVVWNDDAFCCRIGRGEKVYRASVAAWRLDAMHEAAARQYGRSASAPIVTDTAGVQWAVNLSTTTVRNRSAAIVGWADAYAGTGTATAHNDYSALR